MGVFVFSAIWGLASVIGLTVNCNHEAMLVSAHPRQCPEQVSRMLYMPWRRESLSNVGSEIVSPLADHNSVRRHHGNTHLLFTSHSRVVEHYVVLPQASSLPCLCISPAIDRPFRRPPQPVQAIPQISFTTIRDIRQSHCTTSHAHLLTHLRDYTQPQELHEIVFNGAWRFLRLHGEGPGGVV